MEGEYIFNFQNRDSCVCAPWLNSQGFLENPQMIKIVSFNSSSRLILVQDVDSNLSASSQLISFPKPANKIHCFYTSAGFLLPSYVSLKSYFCLFFN